MWGKSNKLWLHYRNDILASDGNSAVFLAAYLRHISITRLHTHTIEVLDLQKYKRINKPNKVFQAMTERFYEPFVFFVGKN